ncbi:Sulfotransferase family protein [Ekhidna lutea]|uniref:Sulfotransferase family protein n=1 Tax=Ekhidna lutea TaxID=447679 RepID=A0A239FGJ5_EKHLU|nr:sulfotransferase family 2 domain-containing protein [Ekhidna lutea]SNS55875.1 Sulfotransferase family protein [Ekhidna lutea]
MILSHKHKFIFFSFPKTGSESVRALLKEFNEADVRVYKEIDEKNPFYSHISPIETLSIFNSNGWDYSDYYKFMIVRNPWKRLVSLYEMIYNHGVKKLFRPSFNNWLQTIDNKGQGGGGKDYMRWRKYGTYSLPYYAMRKGDLLVDKVIKLENIDSGIREIFDKLEIELSQEVPKINRRKKTKESYKFYYNNDSIERVYKLYEYEIEHFKYTFD